MLLWLIISCLSLLVLIFMVLIDLTPLLLTPLMDAFVFTDCFFVSQKGVHFFLWYWKWSVVVFGPFAYVWMSLLFSSLFSWFYGHFCILLFVCIFCTVGRCMLLWLLNLASISVLYSLVLNFKTFFLLLLLLLHVELGHMFSIFYIIESSVELVFYVIVFMFFFISSKCIVFHRLFYKNQDINHIFYLIWHWNWNKIVVCR